MSETDGREHPVVIVGYTQTRSGQDALALAARIARAREAELLLVMVLPSDVRSVITPPSAGYDEYLVHQANAWLAGARATVAADLTTRVDVRFAESPAAGLLDAAEEFGASTIVVGSGRGAKKSRHRIGTVADELLYTSSLPVALAPRGSRRVTEDFTGVTATVGTKAGLEGVLKESIALAAPVEIRLRLMSIAAVDLPRGVDPEVAASIAADQVRTVRDRVIDELPDGVEAESVVPEATTIEGAVKELDWAPTELAVIGSSRRSLPQRLFLGSTARSLIHRLAVPVLVVPRQEIPDVEGTTHE